MNLDYCGCGAKSQVEQLLERRLYPATVVNPKTAATFRVLELFELLQYESKLSTYEFYQTISRLTDNTGLREPKVWNRLHWLVQIWVSSIIVFQDRYPTLLRIVHQWRHLKLLKRTGRGHDPVRHALETRPGECALLCPACPHPGINLQPGWENAPRDLKYVFCFPGWFFYSNILIG